MASPLAQFTGRGGPQAITAADRFHSELAIAEARLRMFIPDSRQARAAEAKIARLRKQLNIV